MSAHELTQTLINSLHRNRLNLVLAALGILLNTAASLLALVL